MIEREDLFDFLEAARGGDVRQLRALLSQITLHKDDWSSALAYTVCSGNIRAVRLLVERCNGWRADCGALTEAVDTGRMTLFNLVLPVSRPQANGSSALFRAVVMRSLPMVKILAPLSDVNDPKCSAFQEAVMNGLGPMVEVLLPYTSLKNRGWCLYFAVRESRFKMVRMLSSLCQGGCETALWEAARRGRMRMFQHILPFSNGSSDEIKALIGALEAPHPHPGIIRKLLPLTPVGDVFDDLITKKQWAVADRLLGYMPLAFLGQSKVQGVLADLPDAQGRWTAHVLKKSIKPLAPKQARRL